MTPREVKINSKIDWQLTAHDNLPEMGRKILWFDQGDVWVAMRFFEDWFPYCFTDSKLGRKNAPKYWAYMDLPDGCTGEIKILDETEGKLKTIQQMLDGGNEEDFAMVNGIHQSMLRSFFENKGKK